MGCREFEKKTQQKKNSEETHLVGVWIFIN